MSKLGLGAAVSGVFAIAITVTPVPDEWRPYLVIGSWSLLAILSVAWLIVHFSGKASSEVQPGVYANRVEGDVLAATDAASTSKISTGVGHVNAPIAGRDINYHAPPQAEEKTPHIYPKLQIDSIEEEPGYIAFHFDITNGNIAVEDLRLSVVAKRNNSSEYGSVSGSMAPNAFLSTFRDFIARTENDYDLVTLTIYFKSKVGTEIKNLISRHVFEISKDKLVPGTLISPSRNEYSEGSAPSYWDPESIRKNWIEQLSRETGYSLFNLPETSSNGAPNRMVINVSNKQFIFDWAQRLVAFSITAPSGRVINLQRRLNKSASGYHIVAFGWRKTGGWPRVDDQDELRQYDE